MPIDRRTVPGLMSEAARCSGVNSWPPSSSAGSTSDSVEPTLAAMEKNSSAAGEAVPLIVAALQFEAHHGAEIAHLPRRELVLRMALETRIEYPLDLGVIAQEAAHRQRIGALALVAQEIRAHAPLNQECGVRVERRADRDEVLAHRGDQFLARR